MTGALGQHQLGQGRGGRLPVTPGDANQVTVKDLPTEFGLGDDWRLLSDKLSNQRVIVRDPRVLDNQVKALIRQANRVGASDDLDPIGFQVGNHLRILWVLHVVGRYRCAQLDKQVGSVNAADSKAHYQNLFALILTNLLHWMFPSLNLKLTCN